MNRRGPTCFAIALLALAAARASAATPDADTLIGSLGRAAPASIAFAEVRFSSLLREPLIVAGELRYAGPARLEREVTSPYRERTVIEGDSVRVERDGERSRTFTLRRTPELRGLMAGFGAVLGGDAPAVRRNFELQVGGEHDAWSLELTPLDASQRRRLKQIVVTGSGNEPRCFSMFDTQGGASVMLLGAAADPLPPTRSTLEDLLAACRAE
jgi:Outer membrane lipoprotein carrier protein LolA-like